jgi:hypothetical protein
VAERADQFCCFIPEAEQERAKHGEPVAGCAAAAEWDIRFGPSPDDYTEACTAHVGALLGGYPVYTITPIGGFPDAEG